MRLRVIEGGGRRKGFLSSAARWIMGLVISIEKADADKESEAREETLKELQEINGR